MSFFNKDNFNPSESLQKLLKPAENTVISQVIEVPEVEYISQQVSDNFDELPDFCLHLPVEWKLAMRALKQIHNLPYEFSLVAILGYVNSACQHQYDIDPDQYKVKPISLFILAMLDTGSSKSTTHDEFKDPSEEFEKFMTNSLQGEQLRYETEKDQYKKDVDNWKLNYSQGVKNLPPPQPPRPPETAIYLQKKFTLNGYIDTLIGQGHSSIVSAEAGEFFTGHAFQNKGDSRAAEMCINLTNLWGGDSIGRTIKGERVVISNRRVNMMFMVQSHVIRDILNNPYFQEQGFIHRILLAQIPAFDKPFMSYEPEDIKRKEEAREKLKPLLARLKQLWFRRPKFNPDSKVHYELQPKVLTCEVDALKFMANFFNTTVSFGKPEGKLERYTGFANRLHEHCMRIAATVAVFRGNEQVMLTDAEAAVDMMHLFIEHRYRMDLGIIDTNPELTNNSQVLLLWFQRKAEKDTARGYSLRDIDGTGPSSFRGTNHEVIKTALADLVSRSLVVAEPHTAKNGKVVTRYRLANED